MNFPPDLRLASVVARWGVIRTLERDTVANHSFYVAMYAQEIAKLIDWKQQDYKALYYLTQHALVHDLDELTTGDIVTFIKPHIIDANRMANYVADQMHGRMPGVGVMFTKFASTPYAIDIRKIVKTADWLDSVFFIIGEQRMGNTIIKEYENYSIDKCREAWYNLPGEKDQLRLMWINQVQPAIDRHWKDT